MLGRESIEMVGDSKSEKGFIGLWICEGSLTDEDDDNNDNNNFRRGRSGRSLMDYPVSWSQGLPRI